MRIRPYIAGFEYADFPGYAIIQVSDGGAVAEVRVGDSDKASKSVPLDPKK